MRTLLIALAAMFMITVCNGQPGMVPTTEGGYTMTATVDGKPWKAQAMYPVAANGSIHGKYGESSIDLPYWDQYKPGSKTNFKNGHGPIFAPPGDFDLYSVHSGQMEITKVTGDWMEGSFSFTATLQSDPSKKMEITNGFFRISMKKK